MSTEPGGAASDRRDTVKDAELILSVLGGDIDRVHRQVLAALGLAAVFVTQIPLSQLLALPEVFRVLIVIAVFLLALAAVLLFYYTQKLNLRRLQLAQAALEDPPPNMLERWGAYFDEPGGSVPDAETLDAETLDSLAAARKRWVRPLTYGNRLLGLGGLLLGVVVARLLLG